MFRIVSALVEAFVARALAKTATPAADAHATFGLYPWLARELSQLGWLPRPVTAELVIAWLAFALAIGMLAQSARIDVSEERGEAAAVLAAVFPFASVFGHANADALFLLFAVAAFHGFRQGQWVMAGVAGALATATLPVGILMLPGLAWTGWRREGRASVRLIVALGLTACGLIGYFVFLYYRGGPPGGWGTAMDQWGFHLAQAPWAAFERLHTTQPTAVDALSGVVAVIFLAAVPLVWWRFDGGYALYMLGLMWMALTSGRHEELGRACALMFPVFVLIAGVRWRVAVVAVTITSAMFYALALVLR